MSAWGWVWRVGGVLVLLLFLVVAGLMFYASTPHFLNLVSRRVVTVLEDATGGRVELQSLHWSLRHLAVEVDGLTIHGLEGRGEAPYAHIDRIYARAKILSFSRPGWASTFSRSTTRRSISSFIPMAEPTSPRLRENKIAVGQRSSRSLIFRPGEWKLFTVWRWSMSALFRSSLLPTTWGLRSPMLQPAVTI